MPDLSRQSRPATPAATHLQSAAEHVGHARGWLIAGDAELTRVSIGHAREFLHLAEIALELVAPPGGGPL